MKLLTLLQQLFGKRYINKIIGTKTNVTKPTKMDKNSPFRKYSDDAFSDPKILNFIENKLDEYAPYALSNRNKEELANFEANAQRLLEAKNKQTGTTPGMAQQIAESMFGPLGKKPKPEADIIDIKTQQKVDDTGIMKLKEKLGSPKATETSSSIDNLKEDIAKLTDREARAYSANIESFRRPIIREMLLKDTKIKLPDEVRESLEKKMDLDKGANPEMDPLRLLNEYYDVNFDKLDELEEIRFTARNATEAADEFLKKGGLEPKKDLGDKLKDLPDDIDPDALADGGRPGGRIMTPEEYFKEKNKFNKQKTYEQMRQEYEEYLYKQKYGPRDSAAVGGRIGFKMGTGKGIMKLKDLINKKFGKGTMKTVDEINRPESALNRDMFGEFEGRMNRQTLDVPEAPSGFKLSRERLLKNFPEIDEDFVDEIMAMDRDLQLRVISMLKDRRKNPEAYGKLLMEKGDTLDFQGEFDRSIQRGKNADGGLNYLMGF
jgi:hypothetical protein